MKRIYCIAVVAVLIFGIPTVSQAGKRLFTDSFMLDQCDGFSTTGSNSFFVLEPGYRLVLEGIEDKELVQLTITVLDETFVVDGVETRVVEERETKNGALAEVSRNFFVICNRNNSIIYFGEAVDFYENGEIVGHEGSWLAGVSGARPGIIMPGTVLLGSRYFQEIAPGVALDQAEHVSMTETVMTPAGIFNNCLKVKETNPVEKGKAEFKWHAPGVGLVRDGPLSLVSFGFVGD